MYKIKLKKILNLSFLTLKRNSNLHMTVELSRFCKVENSKIGKYSYLGPVTIVNNCIIGNYCSISSNVKIGLGSHPTNSFSTSPLFYSENNIFGEKKYLSFSYTEEFKQTIVGNDVWIGTNVIILDGVKIGNGAIIAAGSVVTKDVEEYSVVAGVPAKKIKMRFNDEEITRMKKTKWWEKEPEEIMNLFVVRS